MESDREGKKLQKLAEQLSACEEEKKNLKHDVNVYREALKLETAYQTKKAEEKKKKSFKDELTLVVAP